MDKRRVMSILSDYKAGHEDMNTTVELIQKLERSDNKDYVKCCSEIIHIINTMAYPEASIESVLKKHFA